MKTNPGSTTLLIQITNHKKNKKHPQIPIHITLTKITKKYLFSSSSLSEEGKKTYTDALQMNLTWRMLSSIRT